MGKKYLSSADKVTVVTVATYVGYMDELVERFTALKRPKHIITNLKQAKTWGRKALKGMLEEVHADEVEKILGKDQITILNTNVGTVRMLDRAKKGEVDKMEVVVRYKDQAVREYEKMQQLDSVTPVDSNDLMELITLATASCNLCDSIGDDVEGCRYRKLFIKYDAEPFNLEPGDGCPYRK